MGAVTLTVPDKVKSELKHFRWVNWSEVAKEEFMEDKRRQEAVEQVMKIVSKSKFTEKDADILSEKVKTAMHRRLKREGLI